MTQPIKTFNDLVYAVAARAGELNLKSKDELMLVNGYGCNTPYECRQKDKHKTRGTILEEILIEEFTLEINRDIEDD